MKINDKTKKIIKIIVIILIAAAFIALAVWLTPMVLTLRDPEVRSRVRDTIREFGVYGIGLMFILQILQIVVAVIPGEPIELLMGFMYGTAGGMAMCLAGIAAGTALVFAASSRLGSGYIEKINSSEKYKKLGFLRDPAKRDAMFFVLFLIPGTPKDILTYFAPLTKIPLPRFIIISCVARIPSVISSTYIGATLSEGSYLMSAIVTALTALLGIAGIIINNRIMAKHNESK